MPLIPAFERQKQSICEFKSSLPDLQSEVQDNQGYIHVPVLDNVCSTMLSILSPVTFFYHTYLSYGHFCVPHRSSLINIIFTIFIFVTIIKLHHFYFPLATTPTYSSLLSFKFMTFLSLIVTYIHIPKYNLISLHKVTCTYSHLTIRYWIINRCAFLWERLFLSFSEFLGHSLLCNVKSLWSFSWFL